MLDANLPTFVFKPQREEDGGGGDGRDDARSTTIYYTQHGDEPRPEYVLRRADPALPAARNRYGLALFDSYNRNVLFAEVVVTPESDAAAGPAGGSGGGGAASSGPTDGSAPILIPNSFTIQLYNPAQQVVVRKQAAGTFGSSLQWEFAMPAQTFRQPSASALDRAADDPAASSVTPKIAFRWKRDSKLSKDISCYLAGRSTTSSGRESEPDITVGMFRKDRMLTIYQPNMHRVDVEDVKGLEVVLLLSAAVIKDLYFYATRDMFNLAPAATSSTSTMAKIRRNSTPSSRRRRSGSPPIMSGALGGLSQPASGSGGASKNKNNRPLTVDEETARLRAQVAAEERARAAALLEEEERIKRMLAAEEAEQQRRDAEVARETERLRRQYGVPQLPARPAQQQHYHPAPAPYSPPGSVPITSARPTSMYVAPSPHNYHQQQPALRPQAISHDFGGATYPHPHAHAHSQVPPLPRPSHSLPLAANPQPQPQPHAHAHSYSNVHPSAHPNSPYLQAPGAGSASASTASGFLNSLMGRKPVKKRSVYF